MSNRNTSLICAAACLAMAASSALAVAPFTLAAMGDIQNETQYYPAMLQSQVTWIANNRVANNIAFVAQQGDLTNNANVTEFTTAHNAMFQFSALASPAMPWGVCSGNHDAANYTNYETYFGPSNFAGQSYYGATTYSHSSYQTFAAGGRNFLVLDLEFDPSNAVLSWAQSIINANPGKPTIVNTHDYIAYGNTRSPAGNQIFNGAITASGGYAANPDGLIYGNSQVFMVLCGHNHYQWNQTSTDKAGKTVFECLADYQDVNSGDGYIRLYQFDEANSVIHATTYSPYDATTASNTPYVNQFDLPIDFNARLGVVPEPTSLVLILVGACTLGTRRRRA